MWWRFGYDKSNDKAYACIRRGISHSVTCLGVVVSRWSLVRFKNSFQNNPATNFIQNADFLGGKMLFVGNKPGSLIDLLFSDTDLSLTAIKKEMTSRFIGWVFFQWPVELTSDGLKRYQKVEKTSMTGWNPSSGGGGADDDTLTVEVHILAKDKFDPSEDLAATVREKLGSAAVVARQLCVAVVAGINSVARAESLDIDLMDSWQTGCYVQSADVSWTAAVSGDYGLLQFKAKIKVPGWDERNKVHIQYKRIDPHP